MAASTDKQIILAQDLSGIMVNSQSAKALDKLSQLP
jgi:hypothetical protein